MPDLEPASALAERILDDYPNIPGGAKLIESDRAAVREAALREAFAVVVEAFQGQSHERHPALFRAYCAIADKLVPLAQKEPHAR